MSFWSSCSWRLIVCVEMTTFFPSSAAARIAGTRYAKLLPTPVPASTIRCAGASIASATASAMRTCSARDS